MPFVSRTRLTAAVFAVAMCFLAIGHPAPAGDWPNWRGSNHDGISSETGFKTTWAEPPKVLWTYPTGSAFSSFAVVGNRAYTCGTKAKQQTLFCLDADTGKVIWENAFEKELKERQGGDGTRATPTVDEGRVYVLGAFGLLLCVNAEDGKEVWKQQYHNKPQWAYSGSVLIEGDMAVVSAGAADGALLALDKKTGKSIWKCGKDPAGYSTPYPFTFDGKRLIAGLVAKAAIIADAATGKQLCSIPWTTDYDVNASELIYHEGHLFISTGYNTGCALYRLTGDGGSLSAKQVWKNKALLTKFTSCVLKDGMLYGGHQRGMSCVDFMTGKECWSERRLANASIVLAADQLIVFSEDGKLLIAKATPAEFKPTAQAQLLSGRCWTVPTLANGRLFVRNFEKAECIDLKGGGDR
jgi:outer membrane protein assembly factor BamB